MTYEQKKFLMEVFTGIANEMDKNDWYPMFVVVTDGKTPKVINMPNPTTKKPYLTKDDINNICDYIKLMDEGGRTKIDVNADKLLSGDN